MPGHAALREIAQAVSAVRANPRRTPLVPLLDLAAALLPGHAVTVDFQASARLGLPLVVVQPAPSRPAVFRTLTPRERQVTALLAQGLTNATIARGLRISVPTVKDHVHHILTKTRCRRRTQVVALWSRAEGV